MRINWLGVKSDLKLAICGLGVIAGAFIAIGVIIWLMIALQTLVGFILAMGIGLVIMVVAIVIIQNIKED